MALYQTNLSLIYLQVALLDIHFSCWFGHRVAFKNASILFYMNSTNFSDTLSKSGSMLLRHPAVVLDWLAGFESPFAPHSKSALCNPVTVEAT